MLSLREFAQGIQQTVSVNVRHDWYAGGQDVLTLSVRKFVQDIQQTVPVNVGHD